MKFKSVVGFIAKLNARLAQDSTVLPIDDNTMRALYTRLGEDAYTYLTINDGAGKQEIVKVTGFIQGSVIIERAQSGTVAHGFAYDACVSFVWTDEAIKELMQNKAIEDHSMIKDIKSECFDIVNKDGVVSINSKQKELVFRVGNQDISVSSCGVISAKDVSVNQALADGEYKNATIVIKNAQIASIKEGANLLYTAGCCDCHKS